MQKRIFTQALIYIILLFSICSALTACMYSAAVSGAQAVYDRHSIQHKWDDSYTSIKAYRSIYHKTDEFKDTHVAVATYNNTVLVVGQVPNPNQKDAITALIQPLAGERKVYNFVEVASPSSQLIRVSDSWITAKIKSKMVAVNDVDPTKIKVVTENGTVYLMGTVPHEEADSAVHIAQTTAGVQKVVKVFSYVTIMNS